MKKFTLTVLVLVIIFSCSTSDKHVITQRYKDYYPELNKFYSEKPPGWNVENGYTVFRLFAPRATEVKLVLFKKHNAATGDEYLMKRDKEPLRPWGGRAIGPRRRVTVPTEEEGFEMF